MKFLRFFARLSAAAGLALGCLQAASRPNVVIILTDDLGYGDPGCYNPQSKIATPAMDRMAEAGVRFTAAHAADAVCTPSRYGVLTGRYCWRTRLKRDVLDGFSPPLIEPSQTTLASFLHHEGYATACICKWHLGMQWTRRDGTLETVDRKAPGFRPGDEIDWRKPISGGPLAVGFDRFYGISGSLDMPPYCWIENDHCAEIPTQATTGTKDMFLSRGTGVIAPNFKPVEVLPTLKARAVDWIEQRAQAGPGQPFFLYLALNSPHLPVAPSPDFVGKSKAGLYGDYVMETDDAVGAVIAALKHTGVLDNTIVVLTSDNGGLWHDWDPVEADDVAYYKPTGRGLYTRGFGHQSNGELRGTKADIWEGGHRIPLIVQWPQVVKPGVAAATVELTDLFATVAEILGRSLPSETAPDSFSFYSLLVHPETARTLRPFSIHHSIAGVFAVTEGDWKFVESRGSGGFSTAKTIQPKPGEATGQLYNVRTDLRETKNLFLSEPERVAHFQALLQRIKASRSLRQDWAERAGGRAAGP